MPDRLSVDIMSRSLTLVVDFYGPNSYGVIMTHFHPERRALSKRLRLAHPPLYIMPRFGVEGF
jgi:hypothetical protein